MRLGDIIILSKVVRRSIHQSTFILRDIYPVVTHNWTQRAALAKGQADTPTSDSSLEGMEVSGRWNKATNAGKKSTDCSTVRLLEASSGAVTAELLGFAAAGVSNEETFVVLNEQFFEFSLGGFVVVLLRVGDDGLGDGLTDGHNLGGGTTSGDTHADVEVLEAVGAEEEYGFPDLEAEGGGFEEIEGLAVDFDEAGAGGGMGDCGGVLLSSEALYLLCFSFSHLLFL